MLAAVVVALNIANEVRDIKLGQITARQMQEKHGESSLWRFPLWIVVALRQFALLPMIVAAVPVVVRP